MSCHNCNDNNRGQPLETIGGHVYCTHCAVDFLGVKCHDCDKMAPYWFSKHFYTYTRRYFRKRITSKCEPCCKMDELINAIYINVKK